MSDNRFTWMHSGQLGAPQMNGAAGSNGQMLQVLDGCLTDGFNPQTVVSATKSISSVTLTFGVNHGYELGQLILISGAVDTALNGRHRVINTTENSITVDAIGINLVTGIIATKVAPLGFESIFGSTDPLKRAYRSTNAQSTKTVLYLDMTLPTANGYDSANPAKRAMVSLCEDMTTLGVQIGSYTDTYNDYATNPNGSMFWYQARQVTKAEPVNEDVDKSWVIVGCDNFFYLFNNWGVGRPKVNRDNFFFGDFPSLAKDDNYNCCWSGATSKNDVGVFGYTATQGAIIGNEAWTNTRGFIISSTDGVKGLQPFAYGNGGAQTTSVISGQSDYFPYPSAETNGIVALPIYLVSGSSDADRHVRGVAPNINFIPQTVSNTALDIKVEGGFMIVFVQRNSIGSGAPIGCFALKVGD